MSTKSMWPPEIEALAQQLIDRGNRRQVVDDALQTLRAARKAERLVTGGRPSRIEHTPEARKAFRNATRTRVKALHALLAALDAEDA